MVWVNTGCRFLPTSDPIHRIGRFSVVPQDLKLIGVMRSHPSLSHHTLQNQIN